MGDPARPTDYLPTLDGWRAVAVLLVLLYHAVKPEWLGAWAALPWGPVGVDIFFGLSGFLITTKLLGEWAATGRIDLRRFYLRRAFRILPPAWAYLIVLGLLAVGVGLAVTAAEYAGCLLFARNYFPRGESRWYTSHYWSLSVEEQFYLVLPGVLVWAGPRRAAAVFAAVAVGSAALRAFGGDFARAAGLDLPPGTFFYTRTHVRLDGLMAGCCAAAVAHRYPELVRRRIGPALGAAAAAAVLLTVLLPAGGIAARSVLVPVMLLGTVNHPASVLATALEWAPVRWLGRLSYSIYIWQQLFLVESAERRSAGPAAVAAVQDFPWAAVGLLAAAVGSHYLIERPFVRLGRRLTRKGGAGS